MSTVTPLAVSPATRRGFLLAGTALVVGAIVAIVMSAQNDQTMWIAFLVPLALLGTLYAAAGVGVLDLAATTPGTAQPVDKDAQLFWWALVLTFVIPGLGQVIGLISGAVLLNRGRNGYGLWLLVSPVVMALGFVLLYLALA